jgi:SAM-dependent methyltransferase
MKSMYYRADGISNYLMNDIQQDSLNNFKLKIKSGEYEKTTLECICGNNNKNLLNKISEKDRYGISVNYYLCNICGLVFQKHPLSKHTLKEFYRNEYNKLYKGRVSNLDVLFDKALKRGNRFYDLINQLGILDKINTVYESGCATGANLYPFYLDNKSVSGFDYDDYLLNYGRNRGLPLFNFDEEKGNVEEKYDLIISSHVIEHVLNPIDHIRDQIKCLKVGKYFLLEVPGILFFHKNNNTIIDNLVNAHIYYFHEAFLINVINILGLRVIYSDQRCTLIFQKTNRCSNEGKTDFKITYDGKFWYRKIKTYLDMLYFREKVGIIKTTKYLKTFFHSHITPLFKQ